jgi:transcriptional regulator with XRE-family HTH domain
LVYGARGFIVGRMNERRPFGDLLREWRQRRRLSQLGLALDAEVSAKHLSFVETGRAQPSREMVLRLAERLDVPLRERNALLLAAGFAPLYRERPLVDPALESARRAVDRLLAAHEPYPALALDRHWNLVLANRLVAPLMAGAAAHLVQAPINVLRLSLHPHGVAPRIVNLAQWRTHLLQRLQRQVETSGDPELAALLEELREYPVQGSAMDASEEFEATDVVVPLQLATDGGVLSFFSATTIFGSPVDVTLAELAIESFFPADASTAKALERLAATVARTAS